MGVQLWWLWLPCGSSREKERGTEIKEEGLHFLVEGGATASMRQTTLAKFGIRPTVRTATGERVVVHVPDIVPEGNLVCPYCEKRSWNKGAHTTHQKHCSKRPGGGGGRKRTTETPGQGAPAGDEAGAAASSSSLQVQKARGCVLKASWISSFSAPATPPSPLMLRYILESRQSPWGLSSGQAATLTDIPPLHCFLHQYDIAFPPTLKDTFSTWMAATPLLSFEPDCPLSCSCATGASDSSPVSVTFLLHHSGLGVPDRLP